MSSTGNFCPPIEFHEFFHATMPPNKDRPLQFKLKSLWLQRQTTYIRACASLQKHDHSSYSLCCGWEPHDHCINPSYHPSCNRLSSWNVYSWRATRNDMRKLPNWILEIIKRFRSLQRMWKWKVQSGKRAKISMHWNLCCRPVESKQFYWLQYLRSRQISVGAGICCLEMQTMYSRSVFRFGVHQLQNVPQRNVPTR